MSLVNQCSILNPKNEVKGKEEIEYINVNGGIPIPNLNIFLHQL